MIRQSISASPKPAHLNLTTTGNHTLSISQSEMSWWNGSKEAVRSLDKQEETMYILVKSVSCCSRSSVG